MAHADRLELPSFAQWYSNAWCYGDPRERKHHAVVDGPEQFARGLHASGTFGKHDCQRLIDGAFAEFPGRHEARNAEHVIGMPMRNRQHRGREHVGAEGQLRAFAAIDQELERPMPEPVGKQAPAETAHHVLHLTHCAGTVKLPALETWAYSRGSLFLRLSLPGST